MNNNVRVRRIIAWIIDWNLSGLPCLLYTTIFMDMFKQPSFQNIGYILIFMLLVFLYPITFVFRDVIFKGRSIGKRIFRLYVLDKNTNEPASVKHRIAFSLTISTNVISDFRFYHATDILHRKPVVTNHFPGFF